MNLTPDERAAALDDLVAQAKAGADLVALVERAAIVSVGLSPETVIARLARHAPKPDATALTELLGKKGAKRDEARRLIKAWERASRGRYEREHPLSDLERLSRVNTKADEFAMNDEARTLAKQRRAEGAIEGDIFVDVAALGDEIAPPKATAGMMREDGVYTLPPGEWSGLTAEPGAFKSGLAAMHEAETLQRGGRVLHYELDGNMPRPVIAKLRAVGVPLDVLQDPNRFRLVASESPAVLEASAELALEWLTDDDLIVVDAAGGLVAAYGGDSNSADDWMRIYQTLLAPLISTGAAGLLLDHVAKTAVSSGYATGTGAKKKTMHGVSYGLAPFKDEPPRPESVGKVALTLLKDSHGVTGYAVGECVAVLEVDSRDSANGPWTWRLMPGRPKDERTAAAAAADVDFVLALTPFPTSRTKLQDALKVATGKGWANERANAALEAARSRRNDLTTFPIESIEQEH